MEKEESTGRTRWGSPEYLKSISQMLEWSGNTLWRHQHKMVGKMGRWSDREKSNSQQAGGCAKVSFIWRCTSSRI